MGLDRLKYPDPLGTGRYFETRLKAVPVPGYRVAQWMIGFEENPEQSAEIFICELFGDEVAKRASTIGYGIHPFNDPSIKDDFHRDTFDYDSAYFHVYAAEWTPTQVEFFLDNTSMRVLRESPQYPMQFMLGIYGIPDRLRISSLEKSWPKRLEVDSLRGYQLVAGYETNE